MESVEWINSIIKALWPNIQAMTSQLMKETVEPILQKAVPSALKSIHFTKTSLGTRPIRVEQVQMEQHRHSIHLNLDLDYSDGDCDIMLQINGLGSFGVAKLNCTGRLRITMKPLLQTLPLIGAIQVAFVNPPCVTLEFRGLASLADSPVIAGSVRSVINSTIASTLVLPNTVTVKLADHPNLYKDIFSMPLGVLRFTVVEGRKLPAMDKGGLVSMVRGAASDPYCIVRCAANEFRTQTVKRSLDPVWGPEKGGQGDFPVFSRHQRVQLQVWDDDVGRDDLIGEADVEVNDLLKTPETVIPLKEGSIKVRSEWLGLSTSRTAEPAGVSDKPWGLMVVLVVRGTDLPDMVGAQVCSPSLRVTLGKTAKATKVFQALTPEQVKQMKADGVANIPDHKNPVWEDYLIFYLNHGDDMLTIELIGNKKEIGTTMLPLNDVLIQPDMNFETELGLLAEGAHKAKIFARFQAYAFAPGVHEESKHSCGLTVGNGKESVEWVNGIVRCLWPHLEGILEKVLKESVEPQIKAAVPAPLKSIHFFKTSLGTSPIKIEKVHVELREHSIHLYFDLNYTDGDCDIQLLINNLGNIGVGKLNMLGSLRVVMKPLLQSAPLIGGIQVSFVNPPTIDMDFKGLADIADIPILARVVRSVINTQIGAVMVMPKRLIVKLVEGEEVYQQLYHLPNAVLRLTLIGASGLEGKDRNLLQRATSDPYCIAKFGDTTWTTETVHRDLNPTWGKVRNGQRDVFMYSKHQLLQLSLYDEDKGLRGSDDFLGEVVVPVESLLHEECHELSLQNGRGTVRLTAASYHLVGPPASLVAGTLGEPGAVVSVLVLRGRAFPDEVGGNAPAPAVAVRMGGVEYSTKTVQGITRTAAQQKGIVFSNATPEWEESFEFITLDNPETEVISFTLFNAKQVVAQNQVAIREVLADPKWTFKGNVSFGASSVAVVIYFNALVRI